MYTSSPVIKAIALKTSLSRIEVRNLRISELVQVLPEGYTHAPRPTDVSSSPTVAHRCDERRGCIWFTKEKKKERKGRKERRRRRREKKGGKIHLSVTPLLRFIHSLESLGAEREGKSEALFVESIKKGSQHPRRRVDRPYLKERNPYVVKPLDRPWR